METNSILSQREIEIVELLSQGKCSTEIALGLCISKHTVDTHRRNILRKLDLPNTASAGLFAFSKGLLSSSPSMRVDALYQEGIGIVL